LFGLLGLFSEGNTTSDQGGGEPGGGEPQGSGGNDVATATGVQGAGMISLGGLFILASLWGWLTTPWGWLTSLWGWLRNWPWKKIGRVTRIVVVKVVTYIGAVLVGLTVVYAGEQGATFGANGLADILAIGAWGFAADLGSRGLNRHLGGLR